MYHKITIGGIYKIEHISGYYYIGKSVDCFGRWGQHYSDMKMCKHHSPAVQSLFNRTNITEWTFNILAYLSKTRVKEMSKLKGKSLDILYNRILLQMEKEEMAKYSINFALNKINKHYK
jgi:hypothetical protein